MSDPLLPMVPAPAPRPRWYNRIPWGRYATEVLVIFIGITVSFAFDQWKKGRENAEQERLLLSALRQDLQEKLAELESDSLGYSEVISCTKQLPQIVAAEHLSDDQIQCVFQLLEQDFFFERTTPSYEVITGNDQWKLIRQDSLKRDILRLYESDYKVVEWQYGNFSEVVREHKRPYVLTHAKAPGNVSGMRAVKNLREVLAANEMQTMLFSTRANAFACRGVIARALASTRKVITELDRYLAAH